MWASMPDDRAGDIFRAEQTNVNNLFRLSMGHHFGLGGLPHPRRAWGRGPEARRTADRKEPVRVHQQLPLEVRHQIRVQRHRPADQRGDLRATQGRGHRRADVTACRTSLHPRHRVALQVHICILSNDPTKECDQIMSLQ